MKTYFDSLGVGKQSNETKSAIRSFWYHEFSTSFSTLESGFPKSSPPFK